MGIQITFEHQYGEARLLIRKEFPEEKFAFEREIISQNRIRGLLPCRIRESEEACECLYEITNRSGFATKFLKNRINTDTAAAILAGLGNAIAETDEYLLRYSGILAEPEYIYLDRENGAPLFVYCPFPEAEEELPFLKLAEFMVERTDHGDDAAIDLSYGFYQKVIAREYDFHRLIEKDRAARRENGKPVDPRVQNCNETAVMSEADGIKRKQVRKGGRGILTVLLVTFLILCFTVCLLLLKYGSV